MVARPVMVTGLDVADTAASLYAAGKQGTYGSLRAPTAPKG